MNVSHNGTNLNRKIDLVDTAVKFVKIGRIDTKTERFDATLIIESSWEDQKIMKEIGNLAKSESKFIDLIKKVVKAAAIYEFNSLVNWTPNLVILNAIGDLKEEICYRIEVNKKNFEEFKKVEVLDELEEIYQNLSVRVTELRKIKGTFYQPFDLREFPLGNY